MCYNCIVLNPQKDKKRKAAALTNAGEEQGSADEVAAASFTAQQLGTDTDTYIHTYIHTLPALYLHSSRPLPSVCDKNYVYIQVGNY